MTLVKDITTQLGFSSNLAGIVANKIEQNCYSVYSYSGIESIERALSQLVSVPARLFKKRPIQLFFLFSYFFSKNKM